ncbi:alpha/beta fold hydrolase [Halobacillus salinus]|uniref:Alpha/beta fold hydrolase n=1 Tax=Halobacillus salinus TaxID=192814 RepID=A0A4Z0GWA4_9BACI|nr:alpha/beta fold hydrolase [Halobacillus salinus]TGB02025.1 alpha/beta fold hydrolase [Halobacillus salinus]
MEKLYMLHGFMGTGEEHFQNQIKYFESDFEVIAVDLPGHGKEEESAEDYFTYTLNWLEERIRGQGAGYVLGLSLGASLAIHTAMNHPELVKGVILTGYAPSVPESMRPLMEEQYKTFINIEEEDPEVASHFKQLHGEKWLKTVHRVLHMMTYDYPEVTAEQLSAINVPLLLLNGDQQLHEVQAAVKLKEANERFRVSLVPEAGHTPNMDKPNIFNTVLEDWLST